MDRTDDGVTIDLSDERRRVAAWWPVPAFWIAATLLYASALHLEKARLPFTIALRQSVVFWGTLALVIGAVVWWDRRRGSRRSRGWAAVAGEIVAGVAAVALWQGLLLLDSRIRLGPYFWRIYAGTWLFQLLFAFTVYGTVRGLMLAAAFWRRDRERERRETALVLAARDLELSAIRTQFQPHFVLNALNSLLALIDDDPALARTMVVRLADLMKAVFDRGDLHEVPLERELDLVRAYLDVEHIRLGARLSVRVDVDEAARGVLVPPFLLQPIVENAVKHGIAPYARPGTVTVTARVDGDRLHVTVADSGGGGAGSRATFLDVRPSPNASSGGRGLQITRRRLDTAYGDRYALTLDRGADGTVARVDIPLDLTRVA